MRSSWTAGDAAAGQVVDVWVDQRAHITVAVAAVTPVPRGVMVQLTLVAVPEQSPVPLTWNWSSVVGAVV
jgi:hypothetical protein